MSELEYQRPQEHNRSFARRAEHAAGPERGGERELKAAKKRAAALRRPAGMAWRMPGDDLARMSALVRQVGRVELKFTVAGASYDQVRTALGGGAERVRNVYFLDTADLSLRERGVLVRVRGGQQPNDSVVKLRPMVPGTVPFALRRRADFTVEVDVTPDSFVCSGALKRRLDRHDVERAVDGERRLRTLFSAQQLALIGGRLPGVGGGAGAGGGAEAGANAGANAKIKVDDLLPLGPVEVRRSGPRNEGLARGLELQQWTYPDRTQLLEVSTRCTAEELFPTAARVTAFLDRHDIALAGRRPTKADATLAYFARR